jgi:hypothetical protein
VIEVNEGSKCVFRTSAGIYYLSSMTTPGKGSIDGAGWPSPRFGVDLLRYFFTPESYSGTVPRPALSKDPKTLLPVFHLTPPPTAGENWQRNQKIGNS